jgi:hypothetical protein
MKEKGSYTIEAAIVMSAILFIIFAIISAFLLLYQNVVMTYVASQAAEQGAVMWTDTSVQMDGSREGEDTQGYYYRIAELNGESGGAAAKKEEIRAWAAERMSEMIPNSMVGSGAEEINVSFENTFFQRFVVVEIKKQVNIPIAGIMQYFSDDLNMSVKVRAAVSEPAEYIRTLDLAYLTALDLWDQIKGKLEPILKQFK